MPYAPKDYSNLLGLQGLSDGLLSNHFTLYQGYVTNTNKLLDSIRGMETEGNLTSPEYAELKRRLGWEWNGMRLHELYFDNLTKEPNEPTPEILKLIETEFGSFENWSKSFRATAAMRGIGWAVLYYDEANSRLINQWINEHDTAHLAGLKSLLIIDVFEHAFMLDYGIKRADYIGAIMAKIDWSVVASRL